MIIYEIVSVRTCVYCVYYVYYVRACMRVCLLVCQCKCFRILFIKNNKIPNAIHSGNKHKQLFLAKIRCRFWNGCLNDVCMLYVYRVHNITGMWVVYEYRSQNESVVQWVQLVPLNNVCVWLLRQDKITINSIECCWCRCWYCRYSMETYCE